MYSLVYQVIDRNPAIFLCIVLLQFFTTNLPSSSIRIEWRIRICSDWLSLRDELVADDEKHT